MDLLKKAYYKILNVLGIFGGLLLAGIAVGVTIDIPLRNMGLSWFSWAIEVSEYALYASTFFAAPWVLAQAAHVKVDLLVNSLPQSIAFWLEVMADLVGLLICCVLCWSAFSVTMESAELGSKITKQLVVTEWKLLCVVPFSFFLMAVEFFLRIVRVVHGHERVIKYLQLAERGE